MKHAKLPLEMPETKKAKEPVTCLGMTFENDQKRRAYFTEILRQKLPELKKIEGYPIGEDEDILALSDPPYYTACPNPFINDFIDKWEQEKEELHGGVEEEYHKEPFASDVTEGKNDPIYKVHSYHTKVPHKAIMRYILHYTRPGDVIFDGFAGTGMTGVAARHCGTKTQIESLGYKVSEAGLISDSLNTVVSSIGERRAVLSDLSTNATLISDNYTRSVNINDFLEEAEGVLAKVREEHGWMFMTKHLHNGNDVECPINYVVWSEIFRCPVCANEDSFWEMAVDTENKSVKSEFACSSCNSILKKKDLELSFESKYDPGAGQVIRQIKSRPILINYSFQGMRYDKRPDYDDIALISQIEDATIPDWYASFRMPEGEESRRNDDKGLTHTHHYFSKRNTWIMSSILKIIKNCKYEGLLLGLLGSSTSYSTKMIKVSIARVLEEGGLFSFGKVTGTLYTPSIYGERSILDAFESKVRQIPKTLFTKESASNVVATQSTTDLRNIPDECVDYVFVDPPFGANLMYSELNFIWESWLSVWTSNNTEAIINSVQQKSVNHYLDLMYLCFKEIYRIMKSGRWMTVEFSNSRASVWNAIQESIQRAGFIIANVSALDKQQGSFKGVTTTTAVKQDLVISAYKPSTSMIEEIRTKENMEESAWIFVRNHLLKLPVFVGQKGDAELIVERTPRVLFDRMVAYHVQNGYSVPISSAEFQEGVAQRFPMRDGMAFLETQVIEYDKKRLLAKEFVQTTLFVSDENSAIEWLRQQLMQKPQTRQDLHPNFMKELQHISKHELLPELDVLLEQNFLMYDGTDLVPSQIHGYLSTDFKDLRNLEKDDPKLQAKAKNRWYVPDPNKQADLEKLRERSLLREFNSYIEELGKSKKKLRQFRTEAIRAGFKTAWGNQDYQTIVDVGQRLPEKVLQEDSTMLMYYDNAQVRLGM